YRDPQGGDGAADSMPDVEKRRARQIDDPSCPGHLAPCRYRDLHAGTKMVVLVQRHHAGQVAAAELDQAADGKDRDDLQERAKQRGAEAPAMLLHDERGHVMKIYGGERARGMPMQIHKTRKRHDLGSPVRRLSLRLRGKVESNE